jgi:A/G-specific adenine glycosylase
MKMAQDAMLHDGALPPFQQSWQEFLTSTGLCRETFRRFRAIIFHYYLTHQRIFSWRSQITPYRIVVSELMLQQTQTIRVAEKFDPFISAFPDFNSLAKARFAEILAIWKGLGYNRRAKYLQDIAQLVIQQYGGRLPDDPETLVSFPGIGPATAASICAFAFNAPTVFIETNIRTVFIHFFFADKAPVHDRDILPLVEQTLDSQRPREWYYALMDYGVMLKKTIGNLGRKSSHYNKQSRFEGSDRQLRGKILQLLLDRQQLSSSELPRLLGEDRERLNRIVKTLGDDGIVLLKGGHLTLD